MLIDRNHPQLLLELLRQHIAHELEQQAIEAIRPAVKSAVAKVVHELEPEIAQRFDVMKNETVLQLSFREPKP